LAKNKSKSKEFRNNPFKTLKGVATVSQPEAGRPESTLPEKPAIETVEDSELFAREMDLLGVEQDSRDEDEVRGKSLPDDTEEKFEAPPQPVAMSDEEEFLRAMGRMDTVFRDELPPEEPVAATPARMKQLRQGRLAPEASLDLHGLNREQAREKTRFFLEDSVYQGRKTVLIITGRGKGSPDGPVLRSDMQRYLANEARAWVVEWGRAPARYGGDGALVVFLRSHRKQGQ
jgi:DNA-nicking Smr family endonuclease